jgi:hypothetical protein
MADAPKSMTADAYISDRLMQYQGWYDTKAVQSKSRYMNMRAGSVVGAAIVPVIVNLPIPFITYAATVVSLVVVILVSLESVYHFGDQWKNYRSTEQFLSRERVLFLTGEGPYKGHDSEAAFLLLVERCETQIAVENAATLNVLTVAAQHPDTNASANKPR